IHATLIYIVLGSLGPQHGVAGVIWILVLLGSSFIAAWALHAFIERPVEKRLRAWQNKKVEQRAMRRNDRRPTEEPVIEERQ
ncbi:hypothetical protein KBY50_26120, partial [Salmonella enterica subsp. enterica serovar Typhimurium]|nr:hypothetical protein [Salmonella enterica subsp. enterica serovar Typhimurium]